MSLDQGWRDAIRTTVPLWLFVGLIYLPTYIERHPSDDWGSIALDFSTVFVSMLLAMPLYALFRLSQGWNVWARGLSLAAGVATAAVGQTLFDFQFTRWIASNLQASWATVPRDLTRFYGAIFNYVCVYGVNVMLFNLAAARTRAEQQRRDLTSARSAAQQAQLAALRFQLNPHFLFNTLNAISAMIVTGRNREAEQMTEKLCAFLRASLGSDPTTLVPLEEELAVVEDYLEIESVRFGERLEVEIHCEDEAANHDVPSFLLQPLVENAIKYGVSRSRGTVTVAIGARLEGDRLVLTVDDDGRAEATAPTPAGTGTGLENVRLRLEGLYGKAATLVATPHEGGFRATVKLPA